MEIAFGPVPSRRLGRSLGVNNIPNKICTYSCVYCQLGNTINFRTKRMGFYDPSEVVAEVGRKIEVIGRENIDYVTFVPDGEPTLDTNLGMEASRISDFGVKVAVITNSSLIWDGAVRNELNIFDLVSLKVDAVTREMWNRINRPASSLDIERIKEGIIDFSKEFGGKLITETMLVGNIDYTGELERIASFLQAVDPDESFISIPIRPTPERWAVPPAADVVNTAYQLFSEVVKEVELLVTSEGENFYSTGDFENDFLGIISVHPMRDDALSSFLKKYGRDQRIVDELIKSGKVISVHYDGHYFYLRRFRERETLF
ncbi:MAG: radical SAM protein [Thermoplasmata archaeon]